MERVGKLKFLFIYLFIFVNSFCTVFLPLSLLNARFYFHSFIFILFAVV